MAKAISHVQGKGSIAHNNRKFSSANVDRSRTKDNVIFINEPIADAYHKLFDGAVAEFNAKQKRNDRKKNDSYFFDLFHQKPSQTVVTAQNKEKSFYEDVVQIGNMQDTAVGTADSELAKECLSEYMNGFQKRNPQFHVFNAVLHMDEATPHLHIDYIPVATGYKTGLSVRNGLAKALEQMGYGKNKDAISRWRDAERKVFRDICMNRGIEVAEEQKGTDAKHYSVPEFKEIQDEITEKKEELSDVNNEIQQQQGILDNLNNQIECEKEKAEQYQSMEKSAEELIQTAQKKTSVIGKKTTYILTEDDFNKYCDAVRSATAVNTQKAEIEDAKKRIDTELNELKKEKQLAEDAWKRALSVKSEYETRMARARGYELSAHDKELKQVELNKRYDIMIKLRDDEREKNKQLSAEIEQLNAQIDTIKQNHNKELDDKDSIIKSKDKVISEKDNEIKGLKDKVQFFSKKLKALLDVFVITISGVNILFNGKDKYEKYRIDNIAQKPKNLFKAIFDTSSSVFHHVNDIFEDKFPSTYYADEIYKQSTLRHTRTRLEVLQRIEDGVSRSVFQQELADAEMKFTNAESQLTEKRKHIEMFKAIHYCAKVMYANLECTNEQYESAKNMMEIHPEITKDNYNDLIASIDDMSNQCVELENKLKSAKSEYLYKEVAYDYADKIISEQEELNAELEDDDVLTM